MDIENHKPEFHDLQNDSQNISKSSGDGRAATYATQLCNRYQNLAATVKVRPYPCYMSPQDLYHLRREDSPASQFLAFDLH